MLGKITLITAFLWGSFAWNPFATQCGGVISAYELARRPYSSVLKVKFLKDYTREQTWYEVEVQKILKTGKGQKIDRTLKCMLMCSSEYEYTVIIKAGTILYLITASIKQEGNLLKCIVNDKCAQGFVISNGKEVNLVFTVGANTINGISKGVDYTNQLIPEVTFEQKLKKYLAMTQEEFAKELKKDVLGTK